jgi:hypothetical protein
MEKRDGKQSCEDADKRKLMDYFETFEWRGADLLWAEALTCETQGRARARCVGSRGSRDRAIEPGA